MASVDLGTGKETIEVLNQTVSASSLTVEGTTGKLNNRILLLSVLQLSLTLSTLHYENMPIQTYLPPKI